MDPVAAWERIQNECVEILRARQEGKDYAASDLSELRDVIDGLSDWLDKDGYCPVGIDPNA